MTKAFEGWVSEYSMQPLANRDALSAIASIHSPGHNGDPFGLSHDQQRGVMNKVAQYHADGWGKGDKEKTHWGDSAAEWHESAHNMTEAAMEWHDLETGK